MGGEPKQFRALGGVPVLVRTLRALVEHPRVGAVVVAVPEARVGATRVLLRTHGVTAAVVPGGTSRQASVAAAVQAVPEDVRLVLVHDAARPFVTADVVGRVIEAAEVDGAAAAAVPVTDTLRRAADGAFLDAVDRHGLWAMQTPQGARRDWMADAHRRAAPDDPATDDVELLQRAGYPVRLVDGDRTNVKLTRPEDWRLAEAMLRADPRSGQDGDGGGATSGGGTETTE